MKFIPFLITFTVTLILVIVLSIPLGIPPLGSFLSPQHGFWANAENVDKDYSESLNFPDMKGKVDVYFDDRLVPHVFAEHEEDAFFVQGYLHAKFRLWQMEFQTHAAAGRLSELLGPGPEDAILNFDRDMRRLGMVFGAERSLVEMEKNPITKSSCDAYTAGVNTYIRSLHKSQLPIEYKLLSYQPELWSNLKTALFLKYMSLDLAGAENDFEYTNAMSTFGREDFEKMYPVSFDSLEPVVPKGTPFAASTFLQVPLSADSIYFKFKEPIRISEQKPEKDNGSNNWAVSGIKTKSGKPILCNDPHLSLNLPSLWYEMQISTPEYNAYGATFPGAPSVIIGYNDNCAWGFTNAMRDVRDYYEVTFRDDSRKEYMFNNSWKQAPSRIEEIKVRGRGIFRDTVAYTEFGPVMYDKSYTGKERVNNNRYYAVKWKAHEPSNELMMFNRLNRAKSYDDYYYALQFLQTPGQNCLFASKSGDIAIWQQANFPAKWRRQGDFVMPGTDSSYFWQGNIPQQDNPHVINPEHGFISSANQLPVDTSYPYYIGGHHDLYRAYAINRNLRSMNSITPKDMQRLQTDNYNVFAEMARPVLLRNVDETKLSADEKKYFQIVRNWNLKNDPGEKGVAIFNNWFDSLEVEVWADELSQVKGVVDWPEEFTLVEAMLKDSVFKFIDNIKTQHVEQPIDVVTAAFKKAVPEISRFEQEGNLQWGKFKSSGIRHLLRLAQLSRFNLDVGGGTHIINATKQFHGPSWRMIVHLTDNTEAYGIYPGGQSGNPGSRFYDNFVNSWTEGKYNALWMMKRSEITDKRIISSMTFSK